MKCSTSRRKSLPRKMPALNELVRIRLGQFRRSVFAPPELVRLVHELVQLLDEV